MLISEERGKEEGGEEGQEEGGEGEGCTRRGGGEEGQEERGEGEGCTMVGSSFGIGSSSTVTMSPGMTRVLKSLSRR